MAEMDETNSPPHEASINITNPFIGFEKKDVISKNIEKKKKSLLHLFNKEKDKVIEAPSVNNSHINKKIPKSKSLSLPETDSNYNRNVKKFKKEHVQNEGTESELNSLPSLELTTPTFNLTTPSPSRNSNRKHNVDINDPIYKIPFDYGWKRELVYRTVGDLPSSSNRANRNGDVYYYSPSNKKLRSTREIQEQLNLSLNDSPLTIECFTFVKQPIGLNDRSKEIIRDANAKGSKEDSFTGSSGRPKKVKSPGSHLVKTPVRQQFDYDLPNHENDKPSSKMKVVFKNVKKSKPKRVKNNVEAMDTSSSIPEYINEDCKAIQSCASTSVGSSSKTDDVEKHSPRKKRRLSTSDGEVIMQAPCGIRCPNSQEPATLMCAQCLVYYHPACVNLNANLKIVGYVCINCRSLMQQRNKRVQSSHTVVVGTSEPEQLRVEPIRIRQVHQASETPNFFIDRTPIIKTEVQNNEIDEQHINENNNSDINTVTCQGNVYKTVMKEGNFYEQYVYEMKQTRGPSLMVCVVQEPINLDETYEVNGSSRGHIDTFANMQSLNHMVSAMRHVFKYLTVQELLSASRVCVAWNMIANNYHLWHTVSLRNSKVYDWDQCIETMCRRNTQVLDTRRMIIPPKPEEFEHFWSKFALALKNATQLKCIELYRCPVSAVESAIYSLPQLTVLNASSLKNPNVSIKNAHDLMILNLNYLGQMVQLTELKLKGYTGIKLTNMPSFEKLVNLKTLALTSIKAFPKDFNSSLETVTTNLESLEIGDGECLHLEFAMVLKRFTNLKSLRFENCIGKWNSVAKDVFCSIAGLEKLKILELINIDFTDEVEDGLEKLKYIKALLVIPAYISQSATTNCHLIECLRKLSKTLTHFVWGITHELLRVTDLFIAQFEKTQLAMGCDLDTSQKKRESSNNIPVLRTRKPRLQPGDDPTIIEKERDKDKSDNVDILSIPALKNLLQSFMEHAKIEIVKVSFVATNRVYLNDYFNDV